ncbi:NRDE family protein [Shewanella gaetbuli]
MCILFIAINQHPKYPLIICANRDEFHHRATQPAHFWLDNVNLLAGKDLQAGGTWLGVNRAGQFAGITNLRLPNETDGVRSRGELVTKSLTSNLITPEWLHKNAENYNPFNLIFEHNQTLQCFNSHSKVTQPLDNGFHAICNGNMDDIWPKMALGQQLIQQYISNAADIDVSQLNTFMQDASIPDDPLLPNTGLELEWERNLSAIFIKHPQYGTRSTSIILKNHHGQIDFYESRFDGKARHLGQQHFQIPASV